MTKEQILELEQKIISGYIITFEEGVDLISKSPKEQLHSLANRLRNHFQGNNFDTCSIINGRSGKCSEDCKWCSQSKFYETKINIYPLIDSKEAIEMAQNNHSKGVGKFSIVTSGRTMSDCDIEKACKIYNDISSECSIKLCASMGLLNREQMQKLASVGVTSYHCNMESAPSHFPTLCSTHTQQEKEETIAFAREAGMKICSGGIIGMGESCFQRVEFALYLKSLGVDSVPLNILNPIKGTPLENCKKLTEEEILDTIAILRIANPTAYIRFAGGREALTKEGQIKAYNCGVNGALVGDLLTTVGSNDIISDMAQIKECGYCVKKN